MGVFVCMHIFLGKKRSEICLALHAEGGKDV